MKSFKNNSPASPFSLPASVAAQSAARIHRADHINALPPAGGLHHGRASLQAIGPSERRPRLKARIIQEENHRPRQLARRLSSGYVSAGHNATACEKKPQRRANGTPRRRFSKL
jgi:hypothetical protein